MNATAVVSITLSVFLLALGGTLWILAGPAIFTLMSDFGRLICG